MKYVVVVPDGMADRPLPELDGKTPMQAAHKPNMDALARHGKVGRVQTIPEGMPPGSDVANMALMGYDPRIAYTGRGPLEAASMGVDLDSRDVAFRCNLVYTDGTTMIDYSSGHITTEEARILMQFVNEKLGNSVINFFPGISYRHLLVWRNGSDQIECTPPHDITGKPIESHLPVGDNDTKIRQMMFDSMEILSKHEINKRRLDEGKNIANMIWPWSPGVPPHMSTFGAKFGLTGSVISGVDLVKGIGKYAGLQVIEVPGATGYFDTNYYGKSQYALESLKERDFVFVHVEAPDEAGHEGLIDSKIEAIQQIDEKIVGPIVEGLRKQNNPFRILVSPDHPTPITIKTHVADPVPFILYDVRNEEKTQSLPYDERAIEETDFRVEDGFLLMNLLLERDSR